MSLKVKSGSESKSQAEFATLLAAWADAIVANDAERIAAFAEPDWIITGPEGGPGGLEGFLAVVRSGELTHSEMSFRVLEAQCLAMSLSSSLTAPTRGRGGARHLQRTNGLPRCSCGGPRGGAAQ